MSRLRRARRLAAARGVGLQRHQGALQVGDLGCGLPAAGAGVEIDLASVGGERLRGGGGLAGVAAGAQRVHLRHAAGRALGLHPPLVVLGEVGAGGGLALAGLGRLQGGLGGALVVVHGGLGRLDLVAQGGDLVGEGVEPRLFLAGAQDLGPASNSARMSPACTVRPICRLLATSRPACRADTSRADAPLSNRAWRDTS